MVYCSDVVVWLMQLADGIEPWAWHPSDTF
jgi:hypothetical protein